VYCLLRKSSLCIFLGPEHALLELMQSQGMNAPDFKGEALTFKATTSGVLETLAHCLELVSQREDGWRKRLERETERRKRIEDLYKHVKVEAEKKQKVVVRGGPDFEVGNFIDSVISFSLLYVPLKAMTPIMPLL
jgi:collagen type IV alpha-3-binding protein